MTFTIEAKKSDTILVPMFVDDAILWATKMVEKSQPSKKSFRGSFHRNFPYR
jgi:hypothetical protein